MIRAPQIRVVDEAGEQLGIMSPEDALRDAEAKGLDLVEVAPSYDHAEITALAGATLAMEMINTYANRPSTPSISP